MMIGNVVAEIVTSFAVIIIRHHLDNSQGTTVLLVWIVGIPNVTLIT